MVFQYNIQKAKYGLRFIRDLYEKMFPTAKDYIKFLRERINTLENIEPNRRYYEKIKDIKKNSQKKYFYIEKRFEKYHDNFFEEDYWKDLKPKDVIFYKNLTEKWLKTKTRNQRRIWNYFVLGVPKNSIAPRLKESSNFVQETIKNLEEEFLRLILNR